MAKRSASQGLVERRLSDPLIPWEPEDTSLPEEVKTWVDVYDELLKFAERQLNRAPHAGRNSSAPDPDQRLAALIQRLAARLEFWQQRVPVVR